MEQNSKDKLLIITYFFPPYKNVGARRWAKHAKYLKYKGIDFEILAGDFEGMSSPWEHDIQSYKEFIHRIPIDFSMPYFKRTLPKNIYEKIKWKISYYKHQRNIKKDKYQFVDASKKYTQNFYEKTKILIQQKNISKVVLSVGPFHYSSIIIDLKKQFPEVDFYLDFRDPWLETVKNLNKNQQQNIINLKNNVIKNLKGIITVNENFKAYYQKKYNIKNVMALKHAFDPEDLPQENNSMVDIEKSVKLLYGGSLYGNIDDVFSNLENLMEACNDKGDVKAVIYSLNAKAKQKIQSKFIEVHTNLLPAKEYLMEAMKSDYLILIRPPNRLNAKSSKYFELLGLRKPILYFGGKGEVIKHIQENNLGVHVKEDNISEIAKRISLRDQFNFNDQYNLQEHTFEKETNDLINFIGL